MKRRDLTLLDAGISDQGDAAVLPVDVLVSGSLGKLLRDHLWRYRDVVLRTHDLALMRKPFNKALVLRLIATGSCRFEDQAGLVRRLGVAEHLRLLRDWLAAQSLGRFGKRRFLHRLAELEGRGGGGSVISLGEGRPLYLRTDLVFGLTSGGSVTHIAGVANNLYALYGGLDMITTDCIPTVDPGVAVSVLRPEARWADVPEIRQLLFNERLEDHALAYCGERRPAFIYQRYSVNNIAGVMLAQRFAVPLVIEYNGSEVWINRHWGRALADESLALRLERLNLQAADLVVVVSQALGDELVERGISAERILVNPNGVDPERYRPDIDSSALRARLGLEGRVVLGFVGTFGPWHGAEMLARAAADLLEARPDLRDRLAFLFVGDGQNMSLVREIVAERGIADSCRFTGLVPQADGPAHMAACDILVSPHVPNSDGSRFFGSPTKLFEYMAMGRPIVASSLEQIGELLRHEHDALLVPPGDTQVLSKAMVRLIDDPELGKRLAEAARRSAVERHTWRRHTERILAALDTRLREAGTGVG